MSLGAVFCRLVPRGEGGLCCDDEGVALGPVPLVEITNSVGGKLQYRTAAPEVIGSAFAMAYGPQLEARLQEIYSRLTVIAEAMTSGRHAFARIAAVQMRLPEFAAEGFANRGTNAEIDKYNPRWDIEPRDWHGRWMGDNSGPVIPVIEPYSAECLQAIEAAKKLCIMEYTLRGGELGFAWMRQCIRQHVPSGCGY